MYQFVDTRQTRRHVLCMAGVARKIWEGPGGHALPGVLFIAFYIGIGGIYKLVTSLYYFNGITSLKLGHAKR